MANVSFISDAIASPTYHSVEDPDRIFLIKPWPKPMVFALVDFDENALERLKLSLGPCLRDIFALHCDTELSVRMLEIAGRCSSLGEAVVVSESL